MTSATRAADQKYFRWEDRVGHAGPYRFVAVISLPSKGLLEAGNTMAYNLAMEECRNAARHLGVELCSCYVCGMPLTHNVVWRAQDGTNFVTGLDCAQKADVQTSEAEVALKRSLAARQAAVTRANNERRAREWAAEMASSGWDGFVSESELIDTTYKTFARRERERRAFEAQTAKDANKWLLDVLSNAYQGDFVYSMIEKLCTKLITKENFSIRVVNILSDIYAKTGHGARRNSKKYHAAIAEFADRAGICKRWNESWKQWNLSFEPEIDEESEGE